MTLGERIARLRKQRDLTQDQFAEMIGIHGRHLSRLENNRMRPTALTLSRIAEVFNMSADELVDSTHHPQPTISDPQLLRTFHQAQELDEEDKTIVVRMVQALLTRKKMQQLVGP